jgi:hypothetical protein
MSTDSHEAETLLAAASQSSERSLKIIYAAEARLYLERDRERLRQQSLLLDAIEGEIVRAATQLSLAGST